MIVPDKELKIPVYAKAIIILIGFIALLAILYIARSIIVPLLFAMIIAILLQPIVDFFVLKKINRIVAIIIAMFIVILIIAGFGALIFSQASRFSESWPMLVDKVTDGLNQTISWSSGYFEIKPQIIHDWIINTKNELIDTSGAAIGKTLITIGGVVAVLFLIPVYIFLILFYQPLLLDFIHKLFSDSHQIKVNQIVTKTNTVVQQYLIGLLIEAGIIAALEIATLLIFGIEYAILLGIVGALLNMIPYIGGLIAVALPMMVALATKSNSWYALYILVIYYVIQLIDNNYIIPKLVASKVKINALFSIIAILVGNALWGITGMFLSIPLLAIVKLICDHIEPLKPWGFLLGDTMPPLLKIKPIWKNIKI